MSSLRSAPELSSVSTAQWEEARRVLPVIRGLADKPTRTRADVVAAGAALDYGPTRIYALLRRYLAART